MASNKLVSMLQHPDEIVPLLQMALAAKRAQLLPKDPSLAFCYDMLNKVSRRFAGCCPTYTFQYISNKIHSFFATSNVNPPPPPYGHTTTHHHTPKYVSFNAVIDIATELHPDRMLSAARMLCSFAVVIQQLPEVLRDPVCIFYLVLRALDTIEDDMALPVATKLPLLLAFHEHIYDRRASTDCCIRRATR